MTYTSSTSPASHLVNSIYPPIEHETRSAVDTACAAWHLNRQPQTLRSWACREDGPLRPIRVNGRLAWPTIALRNLLGAQA